MAVKVVTDSTSDIPPQIAQALGITVVPMYIHFGDKSYRDRVDISEDEFYQKLMESPIHPTTSTPTPGDFAEVYNKLAQESDEIVSILITAKESATYNSALLGKEAMRKKCRIEVIDSQAVTMGAGLITIAAAKAAQVGENLERVVEVVRQAIPRIRLLGCLDTLKYVLKGGRLGKAAVLLGPILNVKPLLTMREGKLSPVGMARTRAKGIDRLYKFVGNTPHVEDLAIVHSTTPTEAQTLAEKVKSLIRKQPLIARLSPALGVHGGPGTLIVAIKEGESNTQE